MIIIFRSNPRITKIPNIQIQLQPHTQKRKRKKKKKSRMINTQTKTWINTKQNDSKMPKLTVSNLVVILLQLLQWLVHCHGRKTMQAQNPRKRWWIWSRDLKSLINEVISHSLNNHVTLPWSHGFVVETENQSLTGFLYSHTTRALQNSQFNSSTVPHVSVLGKLCAIANTAIPNDQVELKNESNGKFNIGSWP